MIESVTLGAATDIAVTLLDTASAPANEVPYTDITVQYRRSGQTSFTTKTLLEGEWTEVGDGLYLLTFTDGELSTPGNFRFLVTGTAFVRHERDLLIIDNHQTLNTQIEAIATVLASKTNIADANTLFNVAELRLQEQERLILDLRKRLNVAEGMLGALRATQ
jgi:hypothetical protein